MRKTLLTVLLAFLLVPAFVSANMLAPLSWIMAPLLPFIILIEGFVFWMLAKNWLKIKLGFWKSILVVLIANFITSLIGVFTSILSYGMEYPLWLTIAFAASVIIEWGIFILLFKHIKFLKKVKISDKKLLYISLYVNIASYLPLILLFGSA